MISGKLSKRSVATLGPGRHGDGNGLYLVVDPTGARRWIVRVVIKGRRGKTGAPLRTDYGLGGIDMVSLQDARARAIDYRRMARAGLDPRASKKAETPSFEVVARLVHAERLPTWKNAKHGAQWLSTLEDYVFPLIGGRSVSEIGQPEVIACLTPIWTSKPETARRVAQRISAVLDVARAKGFRSAENPVDLIRKAKVMPKVKAKPKHHLAMDWRQVPTFYGMLQERSAMAARALMFTCLTGTRTGEVLGARWEEFDFNDYVWTIPASRMKGGMVHRVPLTTQMLELLIPLKSMASEFVFEGQRRHRPLSNMAMLMLLRRMQADGVTVHGFRSTFRDWASEAAGVAREVAELSLAHRMGSDVEKAYARSDLLAQRRSLMDTWSKYVTSALPPSPAPSK